MSGDDLELTIRHRMQARADVFDRSLRPAPPLETVLGPASGLSERLAPMSFRVGFAMMAAVVLALAVISGAVVLQRQAQDAPLASIPPSLQASATPSPSPSPSPSLSPSPSPSRSLSPRPSPSPSLA